MATSVRRKASKGTRRPSVVGARALFEDLRHDVGDERLSIVLRTVRSYLSSTTQQEGRDLTALQNANRDKLQTLRALIFADTISSDEVRAYVNRSRPVINKMAREGQLLAIPDGRALRFPKWQFDRASDTGLLPHFSDVLEVMDASPFRKAAWFVSENPRLQNRKPLDLLRAGKLEPVLEEARALVGS